MLLVYIGQTRIYFLRVAAAIAKFIYVLFIRVPTMCVISRSLEQTEQNKQEGDGTIPVTYKH